MFIHVDMDAFFVSCEIATKPELRNKPVVVSTGYKNKGVVASASYTARKCGIKSGMPLYLAKSLCPKLICIEANIPKYASISGEIMDSLTLFSPIVEVYSIDEAYLDIGYYNDNPLKLAKKIKFHIKKHFGLPLTIGIGTSRIVSKAICKSSKPDGIGLVGEDKTAEFMANLDISQIPGIGKKTEQILREHEINTGRDLQRAKESMLVKLIGTKGIWLKKMAFGLDAGYFVPTNLNKVQSIGHSETLPMATRDISVIKNYLLYLSIKIFRRANRLKKMGRGIEINLKFSDFSTISKRHLFDHYIYTYEDIYRHALYILKGYIRISKPVRLVGITLYNIFPYVPDNTLFEEKSTARAILKVYEKYGDFAIVPLSILNINKNKKSIPPKIR